MKLYRLTSVVMVGVFLGMSAAAHAVLLTERNSVSLGSQLAELSGLTWLGGQRWLAVSDKANQVVELDVALSADGAIESVLVGPTHTLDGEIYDFEGIAVDASGEHIVLSEESTPAIHEYRLAGLVGVRSAPTPSIFAESTRPNLGFESLSLRRGHREGWTANEEALLVDGSRATVNNGSHVRLQRFQIEASEWIWSEQYVYQVDPIHRTQTSTRMPQSGLADIIALPGGKLLTMERSVVYDDFFGFDIPEFEDRIYEVDLSDAPPLSDSQLAAGRPVVRPGH